MAATPDEPSRITVSRDALRADLTEMELRLRIYFDEQLKHKADAAPMQVVAAKLDALDRGDFTEVHKRALVALIEEQTAERAALGWTFKERAMAVLSACVTLSMFIMSLVLALHGVHF